MDIDELVESVIAKLDEYDGDEKLAELADEFEDTIDSPIDMLEWVKAVLARMEALKAPDAPEVDELASRLGAL